MNQMTKQVSDTFSKKVERAVCPAGKPYVYIMDMREKGLGVQVTARGTKSYIIRTQHQGRRICRGRFSRDGKSGRKNAEKAGRQ